MQQQKQIKLISSKKKNKKQKTKQQQQKTKQNKTIKLDCTFTSCRGPRKGDFSLTVCSEFSTFSGEKYRGFLAPRFPFLCLFSIGLLGVEPVAMWLLFHEEEGFIKLK